MPPVSHARHQFPPVIIQHRVWLYLRFTLSYPDLEDPLAERGLEVSCETIRRWVLKSHGRMLATVLAGIAEFERELIQERIRSGIAAAKARGKKLGRQQGQRPKSDRLASKVLALVAQGRSCRLVGREVGLSENTVAGIVARYRAERGPQRGG